MVPQVGQDIEQPTPILPDSFHCRYIDAPDTIVEMRDGRSSCESPRSGTIIAPARIALPLYVKMKLQSSRFSALVAVAVCVLSGCASVPQSEINVAATEVKIYAPGKLSVNQYEVVRRIWVDSWRSNFLLPTYPSEADGIASMQAEAARLGADGLINVVCMEQGLSLIHI